MIFTTEEIKNYLLTKQTLDEAINELTNEAIVNCNQYPKSVHFDKSKENLKRYEVQIGIHKLIEEQLQLKRNGKNAKYWMALSPSWIEQKNSKKLKTEYEIMYWVNYGDDETYGWFSVEQITKWLTTPNLKLCDIGGTKER